MRLLLSLSLLLTSTFSWGWTFAELQGTYRIRPSYIPTTITLQLDSRGNVETTQRLLGKTLNCEGRAQLRNDVITSSLVCNHDQNFDVRIDLTEVEQLDSFRTRVWSTKSGTINANFTRVR